MLNFRHLRRTLELRCFCRLAIPHFVELHRKYKDHGLDIVGITYERSDDPNETIRAFANSFEIVYPRVIGDGTAITVQMCFAGEHEVAVDGLGKCDSLREVAKQVGQVYPLLGTRPPPEFGSCWSRQFVADYYLVIYNVATNAKVLQSQNRSSRAR